MKKNKQMKPKNKQKKQKTHNHTTHWQMGTVLLKYTNWFLRIIYFQIIVTGQILFNYFRIFNMQMFYRSYIKTCVALFKQQQYKVLYIF